VSGKGANLASPDGTPVVATLILDAPFATTGQSGEADSGSCKKDEVGPRVGVQLRSRCAT
jgi:hypothetical protein